MDRESLRLRPRGRGVVKPWVALLGSIPKPAWLFVGEWGGGGSAYAKPSVLGRPPTVSRASQAIGKPFQIQTSCKEVFPAPQKWV